MDRARVVRGFQRHFPGLPRCFRAPGRVNLIGEHTDYNDGFVLSMALELSTVVAICQRADRLVNVWSENMNEKFSFSLDRNDSKRNHWSDYVAGVAQVVETTGFRLPGADLYIESNVPVGAGLSSSAAIEISSALAFLSTGNWSVDSRELARIGQIAENRFVGMNCGIMDQFTSVHGQEDRALFLDCRSLNFRLLPLPSQAARIVICNTMVKHELGSSEYNRRRAECEQGVAVLSRKYPDARALRDVTPAQLDEVESELPPRVRKRCRHVISENERVCRSLACLEPGQAFAGDRTSGASGKLCQPMISEGGRVPESIVCPDADRGSDPSQASLAPPFFDEGSRSVAAALRRFGSLMGASHESLRDDYEVSCPELDLMVEIASGLPGCLGARMTGGGFGGCTVNLVEGPMVEAFCEAVAGSYHRRTGILPQIYTSAPARGAHEMIP